jgi:hypothetical protein
LVSKKVMAGWSMTLMRLRRHLHRFAGEHRRRIAGAFHERHACDQRVTRKRLQRELEGSAHHAVDHHLVPGGVDVGHPGMVDGKVKAVGRDGAAEQMMRRARMGIAELAGGIAQRANDVLLEPRRHLHGRHDRPEFEAPGFVLDRLGGGPGQGPRGAGGHRARDRDTLPEQSAAVDQAIAGDGVERGRSPSAFEMTHRCSPRMRIGAICTLVILTPHAAPLLGLLSRPPGLYVKNAGRDCAAKWPAFG